MRPIACLLIASSLAAATTARADDDEPERPFTEREVTAVDVAATPMSDLNLRGARVPAQLIAAQQKPYDMTGLSDCGAIAASVGELDALLGEDLDVAQARRRGPSAGRLAQWAVGTFIPFRGAIREISGANARERQINAAVQAGLARRAFLKGVGEAKGCLYPARSATPDVLAGLEAERKQVAEARKSGRRKPAPARAAPETRLTLAAETPRQP